MTVPLYFLCIYGILYGIKDIFDRIDSATLTFNEKFLYQSGTFCAVHLILQMVSISNSIVFTWCLSNSNLFTSWTPQRAFWWLDYKHCTTKKLNGWPGWRAGQFGVHRIAGRHLSRTGEGLPGAFVNPHEWSEFRVIGHTLHYGEFDHFFWPKIIY